MLPNTLDKPVLKLKTSSQTINQLEIYSTNIEDIRRNLQKKYEQAPQLFNDLPVLVDLTNCTNDNNNPLSRDLLVELIETLHSINLQPFAFRTPHVHEQGILRSMNLIILSSNTLPTAHNQSHPSIKNIQNTSNTKIVTQPVRSGQRIMAENGDLIITAPVSPGAEIIASGNIHAYAPMRGRALAGVPDNTGAHIFCCNLQAELVAIAGQYKISDQIESIWYKKPCQILLEQDCMIFTKLNF